jgi:glycosyltransferase involved in cell wall biosynthesis
VTRPLRIGIDARELIGDTTGVGRYLGELVRRWTMRSDAERRHFTLYTPAALALALPAGTADQRVVGRGTGTWWEQTTLRKAVNADRPDVFFAPAYTAPLGIRPPFAVTIHDISFVAHPEWFRPRERWRRRFVTARTAAAASVVLTDSDFSRGELEARLRISRDRIRVIAPGVASPGTRESGFGIREPLVLYVGSIFNRRRLPDLIAAFARASHDVPGARLVVVGADRSWPAQDLGALATAFGVSSRVELRNYVSDADLEALYARASVFAFLSEYEGFGLTPLEALASGVPVVVLDTPVAHEVYGDAARYVQANDIEGTAAALRSILLSPSSADGQMAQAPAVLARYSWDRAATETLTALEALAG